MVINLCIDRLRERRILWEEWDERLSIASEDNAEVDIIKQEDLVQLHTAIASMSEKDRTVLMLSIVEELSTEEISQILRIKTSSVRSQFCRAKQKLVKLYRYK
jgi:RNA polymerase sigma-70 factor (ECF subfamily)